MTTTTSPTIKLDDGRITFRGLLDLIVQRHTERLTTEIAVALFSRMRTFAVTHPDEDCQYGFQGRLISAFSTRWYMSVATDLIRELEEDGKPTVLSMSAELLRDAVESQPTNH